MAECRGSSKTNLPLLRGGGKIQALESAILGFGSQLSYEDIGYSTSFILLNYFGMYTGYMKK